MQTRKQSSEHSAAWKRVAGRERILRRVQEFAEDFPQYESIAMQEGLSDPVDSCIGTFGRDVYDLLGSTLDSASPEIPGQKTGPVSLKRVKVEREIVRLALTFRKEYQGWLLLCEMNPKVDGICLARNLRWTASPGGWEVVLGRAGTRWAAVRAG